MVLWLLGYPSRAAQQCDEALSLEKKVSHPYSRVFALGLIARVYQFRREVDQTFEWAEACSRLATEQGFAQFLANSIVLRGWVLAMQGQMEEGLTHILQGIASWQATGAALNQTFFLALLAEVYERTGQLREGGNALYEALVLVDIHGERFYEAEIHRLQGQLLLQASSDNHTEAETCFHKALEVARSQQAKSLELRAATSLAKLWQSQGKHDEARELLGDVYGWFTEGFDTADLIDAKVLLGELQA